MKPPSRSMLVFLILQLVLGIQETRCSLRHQKLHEFQTKLQHYHIEEASTIAPSPFISSPPIKCDGRVLYPIGYGADPTGEQDSSDTILNALEDVLKLQTGLNLLPGISDLGGGVIDFQGGNFMISKPIRLPSNTGNLVIQGGTLRASETFPGDRHLIELWSSNSLKLTKTERSTTLYDQNDQNAAIYYEDITFRDILFDSSFRGGGLLVIDSARTRINNCFFIHFTTEGILVERGHETFLSSSFLGEHPTVGGDRNEKYFSGTAIDLASNDNSVTNVAIFSAAIGIILRGQANMITGVHCYNKASTFGGVGILVKAGQSRIDSCYLDYNSIVMEDPLQVHVTNGFFLGGGNVVLRSVKGRILGVNIVNNMFLGGGKSIVDLDGVFTSIEQVVVGQNNVDGMVLKSTVGKLVVAGVGLRRWVADFSSVLVFPNRISHVQYTFYATRDVAGLQAHAVTNVSNNVVVVESERVVDGSVWFTVEQ